MAYDYDALYGSTPNALGEPTGVFVEFFANLDRPSLRILDVGCGQGRDALFIARLGHTVVGVDLSVNGIRDLNETATAEGLAITGIATDLTTFAPDGTFDIVLIDRTLHMLDCTSRLVVLGLLIDCINPGGWLLIADEKSNIGAMKALLNDHRKQWTITKDKGGTLFAQRS